MANNNIWAAPTNKNDTAIIASGSSQTFTLGTPQTHSVLVCLVAWTGAQTVTVTDNRSNSWLSLTEIINGSNHCQMWYVLSANGAGSATITATFTGSVTNIQLAGAEYPVNQTLLAITAASISGSVTTYTCTITEGPPITAESQIAITGMADAGNNTGGVNPTAFIIQTTNGTTTFTVNNPNGVTRAAQSGVGVIAQTQGTVVVGVDGDIHTNTGSSTTPTSGTLAANYGNELWVGYADNGTSSTWTAQGVYTIRSTAAARRAAIEDNFNTATYAAAAAWSNTSNTTWETGAVTFQITSVGTGITVPTAESNAVQAPLLVGSSGARPGLNTDPYGSGASGSGGNRPPGQQVGIASTHIGKR
jgi:hypothetical protein